MHTHLFPSATLSLLLGIILFSCMRKPMDHDQASLQFNAGDYTAQNFSLNGKTYAVRAYENIVYIQNPVDTAYQVMNIYIPEAYFHGESLNGYTLETAPIFFPNRIGGYMPARPALLQNGQIGPGGPGPNRASTLQWALSKGYVVASAGARGRSNQAENGTYYGKAPAAIVDLKAAVRYLKYNDKNMPGNAHKIISNGTSAGGALSALLGATGNHRDFLPYLNALGAADASDDIFAVSAYCPITNLDHSDKAYEWQFNGIHTFEPRRRPGQTAPPTGAATILTPEQIKISTALKDLFPEYLNSLHLKNKSGETLMLNENGEGNFKTYVKSFVVASAQKALDSGADLSPHAWISIENGKVKDLDYGQYLVYLQRMKTPPAFDALDLSSPENQEFGTAEVDKQHFTAFSYENTTAKGSRASGDQVKMMNPMYYIGAPNTQVAPHWRIRHGTKDKDTALAIPVILGTFLANNGFDVDLALPWDQPHGGDYDLEELFEWMEALRN